MGVGVVRVELDAAAVFGDRLVPGFVLTREQVPDPDEAMPCSDRFIARRYLTTPR